jgi:ferritin-like metal-binding protein YciE
MVTTKNELVVAWLNDAYAMENAIVEVLEKQVDLAADHPAVQQGIERHLDATRGHAEMVANLLSQLDEKPSGLKSAMASVGGKIQGMAMGVPKDSLVKAALQDYSTEHMEIASYRALITATDAMGEPNFSAALQGILEDEIAMAQWLEQQLPIVVSEAVAQGSN